MFCGVWVVIVTVHYFIVQYGSVAMKVHVGGLTQEQWLICIVVGFTALPFNFILKFFPDTIAPVLGDENEDDVVNAKADYKELREQAEQKKADLAA